MRRRFALGVLALGAPVAVGGFAYWQDTRFPARSVPVAGIPVELRVQDGVSANELRAIRVGLRSTNRFMGQKLGRTVRLHVEARIARGSGCHPFQQAGAALVGEAESGFMCIDTTSPAWQWLMLRDPVSASESAGHEYVHVLQGELGCLHNPRGERYRWLLEGMAEDVAWQALVSAGRVREAGVRRRIRQDGAFDPNLLSLEAYEREGGRDPEYSLWHFAVERLVARAVADGAAPAKRPQVALTRFCERVGAGRTWKAAFRRSFGVSVERFYRDIETVRAGRVTRF
jgi:hypothetical protein